MKMLKECEQCDKKATTSGCLFDCELFDIIISANKLQQSIDDLYIEKDIEVIDRYVIYTNKKFKDKLKELVDFKQVKNISTAYFPDDAIACIIDVHKFNDLEII